MTTEVASDRFYTDTHEWITTPADGESQVGISDHAQSLLGDVVFVEMPEVGQSVTKGDEIAVIESVKAASDIYAPVSGTISAVNTDLASSPDSVNKSPYEAWLFKISVSDSSELESLNSAEAYENTLAAETA